jgi:hypothetical protein
MSRYPRGLLAAEPAVTRFARVYSPGKPRPLSQIMMLANSPGDSEIGCADNASVKSGTERRAECRNSQSISDTVTLTNEQRSVARCVSLYARHPIQFGIVDHPVYSLQLFLFEIERAWAYTRSLCSPNPSAPNDSPSDITSNAPCSIVVGWWETSGSDCGASISTIDSDYLSTVSTSSTPRYHSCALPNLIPPRTCARLPRRPLYRTSPSTTECI